MTRLFRLLELPPGITAFVGAGGKTTACQVLGKELVQAGYSVVLTTTTHIYPPPAEFCPTLVEPTAGEVAEALSRGRLLTAGGALENGKLTDIGEGMLKKLEKLADFVLVEADGAKRLPCKAPAAREPEIPAGAVLVIGIMGLSALGKPLLDCCFRHELAEKLLGCSAEHRLAPSDLALLAASFQGLRKGTEQKKFSLLLNQRDLASREETILTARSAGELGISFAAASSLRLGQWDRIV